MMELEKAYSIHPELCDGSGEVTGQHCVHIFISRQNEIFLSSESRMLPQEGNLPEIRNGTLTFLEHEGHVYGLTCGHVFDVLKNANSDLEKSMGKYCEIPLPEIAKFQFWVSIGNRQLNVRGRFCKPHAGFGVSQPDIALARLPPDFPSSIGRKCLKMSEWPDESVLQDPTLTGIACGYPEMNRVSGSTATPDIKTLGKTFVGLKAKFDGLSKERIRLLDPISYAGHVNNLSGMSGGPVYWSTDRSWGLAGIVKQGGDLLPNVEVEDADQCWGPTINVAAQPVSMDVFTNWVEDLPQGDFPPQLGTQMYIPEGFRGFRSR